MEKKYTVAFGQETADEITRLAKRFNITREQVFEKALSILHRAEAGEIKLFKTSSKPSKNS